MSKQYLKVDEWKAEGFRRFGPDMKEWRFKCPVCGHVQTPRMFHEGGVKADLVTSECFGRHLPKEQRGGFSSQHSNPKIKSPCDYAAYGFFKLSPIEIEFPDGMKLECFGFAEAS